MLNPQFIGRVALPIFAAVLPFVIIAGQLGLDVCRWWIVYSTATMVAALMGITTFIAPVVLVVVAGSALRRAWIAARRKGKAPGV